MAQCVQMTLDLVLDHHCRHKQAADWFSKLRAVYRLGTGLGVVVVVVKFI